MWTSQGNERGNAVKVTCSSPARATAGQVIQESHCIKIETLRTKNPTEIHGASSEICGDFTVDRTTVSRWANRSVLLCEHRQ